MSHERLAALIQAQREAAHPWVAHETILSILQALDKAEITEGQALRFLGYQTTRVTAELGHAVLYRQAAADIRQMRA